MPIYQRTTSIVFEEADLPERPGDVTTHEIGPYIFHVTFPAPAAPAVPQPAPTDHEQPDPADSDQAQFVPVALTLKRSNYQHAARVTQTPGGRTRVAEFALCNGKANSRAVAARLRAPLDIVDCPRCLKWMHRAGVTITKQKSQD